MTRPRPSHETAYAAFMLDYAAGALSPAETLAGDLHRALSAEGRSNTRLMDAVGAALIEQAPPVHVREKQPVSADPAGWLRHDPPRAPTELQRLLATDLLALNWRKDIFGVKRLPTSVSMAHLLRLDPGERAPAHAHGRRDVTVVLRGTFTDGFGTYEQGQLAFAEPGLRHQPRAVGNVPCVCLLATEPGRPLSGLLGIFGIPGLSPRAE